MSDPFDSVALLRVILEGETDANSPGSEELMSQMRENWEVFLMLMLYTGDSGTATEDPTETVLTDSGATYDVDEHNGRSLVIIDGDAAGNIYTIDDTTATTLICTGDTLLADGIRSGDAYKIFYDLKSTTAHKHDGIDSFKETLGHIKVGTYTGDGTTSQAITGVGFAPLYVRVYVHPTGSGGSETDIFEKLDRSWGIRSVGHNNSASPHYENDDWIIAFGADGFTVDDVGSDAHPNKNGETYDYLALG